VRKQEARSPEYSKALQSTIWLRWQTKGRGGVSYETISKIWAGKLKKEWRKDGQQILATVNRGNSGEKMGDGQPIIKRVSSPLYRGKKSNITINTRGKKKRGRDQSKP